MCICENCEKEHSGLEYWNKRFCCKKCARAFSTKNNRKEISKKVSLSLKGRPSPKKGIFSLKKYTNICIFCNSLTKNRKFCSISCYKNYHEMVRSACMNYKIKTSFKFNVYDFPEIFDLKLLETYGWYSATNRGNNANGVSRDHMYSVKDGFINNINPFLLAHPANCRLILQKENERKKNKSIITYEQLLERIDNFNMARCSRGLRELIADQ